MKNIYFVLFILILAILGCEDENSETISVNFFEFDGKNYEIKDLVILDQYCNESPDAISLVFLDKNFEFEISDEEMELSASAIGHSAISLTNPWSYNGQLQSGEYQISPNSDFQCDIGLNLTAVGDYENEYAISEGIFTIFRNGDNYSVDINGVTNDSIALELEYVGVPTIYTIDNETP